MGNLIKAVDTASTKEISEAVDLVSRIKAGSQEAERDLIQRYSRGAFVIINRIVSNSSDVEDLVQQALITAIEKIRRDELREPERLSGFVCGIARTLALGQLRKTKSRSLKDIEGGPAPINRDRDPLEQLLQKEETAIVRQVIGELRVERDRQVITRFYLIEEEKESICTSLGLTNAHFNKVMFRALARFKELYERKLSHKERSK